MDLKEKVITLKDNKQYIVVEVIQVDNKNYAYLLNRSDAKDTIFREIITEEKLKIKKIDQDLFKNKIYPLFLEKFSKY